MNDPRKNLSRLVSAYLDLPLAVRREVPLLVVGGGNESVFSGARLDEGEGVHLLGYISDEELAFLYRPGAVLTSASLDEGFGIPLVEGHHAGCSLLLSDIPVYQWVCADAASYFDPCDIADIRRALAEVANNSSARAATPLPRNYDWQSSADTILDLAARFK